jgi:hypothetical protein
MVVGSQSLSLEQGRPMLMPRALTVLIENRKNEAEGDDSEPEEEDVEVQVSANWANESTHPLVTDPGSYLSVLDLKLRLEGFNFNTQPMGCTGISFVRRI